MAEKFILTVKADVNNGGWDWWLNLVEYTDADGIQVGSTLIDHGYTVTRLGARAEAKRAKRIHLRKPKPVPTHQYEI